VTLFPPNLISSFPFDQVGTFQLGTSLKALRRKGEGKSPPLRLGLQLSDISYHGKKPTQRNSAFFKPRGRGAIEQKIDPKRKRTTWKGDPDGKRLSSRDYRQTSLRKKDEPTADKKKEGSAAKQSKKKEKAADVRWKLTPPPGPDIKNKGGKDDIRKAAPRRGRGEDRHFPKKKGATCSQAKAAEKHERCELGEKIGLTKEKKKKKKEVRDLLSGGEKRGGHGEKGHQRPGEELNVRMREARVTTRKRKNSRRRKKKKASSPPPGLSKKRNEE